MPVDVDIFHHQSIARQIFKRGLSVGGGRGGGGGGSVLGSTFGPKAPLEIADLPPTQPPFWGDYRGVRFQELRLENKKTHTP